MPQAELLDALHENYRAVTALPSYLVLRDFQLQYAVLVLCGDLGQVCALR